VNIETIRTRLQQLKVEPVSRNGKIMMICPRLPDLKLQEEVSREIMSHCSLPVEWEESIKYPTYDTLKTTLRMAGAGALKVGIKSPHEVLVVVSGVLRVEEDDLPAVWSTIADVLVQDGYTTALTVEYNGQVVLTKNDAVAKVLQGNPVRDLPITKDDVLDVRILVNAAKSVDEFLKSI
jgi:hypothetical protein